jgi:hypothetical protein
MILSAVAIVVTCRPSIGKADTWTPSTTTGAPTGRFAHVSVWTGSKAIVWSGQDGSGPTNTGGLYDPAANSWIPLTTTGAPTRRLRYC